MAFPARYNYLSRIGALSPMPINALLNLARPAFASHPQPFRLNTGFEQDDLALHIRSPQARSRTSRNGKNHRQDPPPNPRPASCRNGIWPISIPVSTRRKSRATSTRWMPNASRLRPTTRASSRNRRAGQGGGKWLAEAVRRYEAIDDLAGRLGSYAGLVHAGDSVDPAISKFYGDVSERLTNASVHLLFFALELNRIDDAVIERAMQTPELGALSAVDRGSAQGQAVSARGSRRAVVSRKIPERLCRLEPAVRPDHLRACASRSAAKELAIEPTLSLLQDRAAKSARRRRRRWRKPSRPTSGPLR